MNLNGLIQRYRRWRLATRGVILDRSCFIGASISTGTWPPIHPHGSIEIGPQCELNQGVELNPWGGHIKMGEHVFLGPYVVIYGHGGVEIGEQTLIAAHSCVFSSNHMVPDRGRLIRNEPDILLPVKIGRDVWLGAGVKVLGGVTIGDGCVVGAGSVVTKDLPPYSISVGIPAKVVKMRE